MKILNLIDSFHYARTNCFQHQLLEVVSTYSDGSLSGHVDTVELSTVLSNPAQYRKYDGYISCLKLRTLARNYDRIKEFVENKKLSVYDQDPWESFRDDGPWKDSYYKIAGSLNATFHVTSRFWSDFVSARGLKCHFVPMWVLPKYWVDVANIGEQRKVDVGFIGQLHPYRKELFDYMKSIGIEVHHLPSQGEYRKFLNTLGSMRVFLHAEEMQLQCEGTHCNLSDGLWIKDIEALSQGCFSIRNDGLGKEDYWLDKNRNFYTYKEFGDIPKIIEQIKETNFDAQLHEPMRNMNRWKLTSEILIRNSL